MMNITPNRLVALLTPLVFAPLAGTISALLARHFPGVELSKDSITAVFVAGAVIALAPAMQWTHGYQKYEARQDELALAGLRQQTAEAESGAPLGNDGGDGFAADESESESDVSESYEPDVFDQLVELAGTSMASRNGS